MREFVLVNTNVVRPPVSPVGLEYLGEALIAAGVGVRVVDLAFEPDWKGALARELRSEPLAVGISVRNTDDCCFATRRSFLPWIGEVVAEVKKLSRSPVILGGVGFSVMPEAVLRLTGADTGIFGDGEEVTPSLARCLLKGEDFLRLPNLAWRRGEEIVCNRRSWADLRNLPLPRRRLFDNRRYENVGAMVGIETKRGCTGGCIYCADPVAKGRTIRLRPPATVVAELRDLLDQGVSWFHLCDSEFNLPVPHALEVCQTIIDAGLGDRIRWYTYCSPTPFDRELAHLMKRAGCAGINFGVDALCNEQLRRLRRLYTTRDIEELVGWLREADLNFMFDLLVGAPGETESTLSATLNKVRELDIPLAGIAVGVRVYPRTSLGEAVASGSIKEGVLAAAGPFEPLYYISPYLGPDPAALVKKLVGGDPRFLLLVSPEEKTSYNYAGDEALCRLIEAGARGAYWDIIRKNR